MKRTCDGCKALDDSGRRLRCELGYSLERKTVKTSWGNVENVHPAEKCPKPTTIKGLMTVKRK